MTTTMAERLVAVEAKVSGIVARVRGPEQAVLAVVERWLWGELLELGVLLMAVFLEQQAQCARPEIYVFEGRLYRLASALIAGEVGTRFGNVGWLRRVGRLEGEPRAARDLPVDRELGLCGRFSVGTVGVMLRLCAQMSFGAAETMFREFHGWCPARRSVLRMVDGVEVYADMFNAASPVADDDGEVLVVEFDSKGAPMVTDVELERRQNPPERDDELTGRHHRRSRKRRHPRPRRKSGEKSKNAKMANVAVIYTMKRTPQGMEGPVNKQVVATFDSMEVLFRLVTVQLQRRGYPAKPLCFLADGNRHIWDLQKRFFPDAQVCLDWWHTVEKFWALATCLFGEGDPRVKAFVAEQTHRLRRGHINTLLKDLRTRLEGVPNSGPGTRAKRAHLQRLLKHLTHFHRCITYNSFRRQDLPIGTGVCEGAVRHLVEIRFDGPGMRWSPQRAQALLRLRCILVNGHWSAFQEFLATTIIRKLRAEPVPTIPHYAARKEAA